MIFPSIFSRPSVPLLMTSGATIRSSYTHHSPPLSISAQTYNLLSSVQMFSSLILSFTVKSSLLKTPLSYICSPGFLINLTHLRILLHTHYIAGQEALLSNNNQISKVKNNILPKALSHLQFYSILTPCVKSMTGQKLLVPFKDNETKGLVSQYHYCYMVAELELQPYYSVVKTS